VIEAWRSPSHHSSPGSKKRWLESYPRGWRIYWRIRHKFPANRAFLVRSRKPLGVIDLSRVRIPPLRLTRRFSGQGAASERLRTVILPRSPEERRYQISSRRRRRGTAASITVYGQERRARSRHACASRASDSSAAAAWTRRRSAPIARPGHGGSRCRTLATGSSRSRRDPSFDSREEPFISRKKSLPCLRH
jgi:hypothetical protein